VTRRPDIRTRAAFAGAVLLGSANIVAVRFSNRELEPLWGAGVRFSIAASVLCTIGLVARRSFPRGRSLRGAVSFGLLAFTGAYAFFYVGAVRVSAGAAGVIMALVPLLTLLLATVQRLERFSWRGLAGSLLAVAGIGVILSGSPAGAAPVASVLLIVAAATCASQAGIVVKRTPGSDVITTNGVAWLSAASYQFVLFPLVTIVLGALVAGESVTGGLLLGLPLVIAGVYEGALRRVPDGQPSSSSISSRPDPW
jgi:drug/metabolite transporter (DMT)-like permease